MPRDVTYRKQTNHALLFVRTAQFLVTLVFIKLVRLQALARFMQSDNDTDVIVTSEPTVQFACMNFFLQSVAVGIRFVEPVHLVLLLH